MGDRSEVLRADPANFQPQGEEELKMAMASPLWRINNLYRIITKDGMPVTFKANEAQDYLFRHLWYRNMIPKARQRGISTAIQIGMLDSALFNDHFAGAVIAQDRDASGSIFRKIKLAYDELPEELRRAVPLTKQTAEELHFANGSSLKVSTSVRGQTLRWLHVSEFGKICAKYPERAREIVTGSLPAVDQTGVVFIESTAEGREGYFFEMTQAAKALKEQGKKLQPLEYRLHFFSWWDADEYETDPQGVIITEEDHKYFDRIETVIQREISERKRAWYVLKRRTDFADDQIMMQQEYPSTVDECFSVSTEGTYYAQQLTAARKEGRIKESLPTMPGVPCMTFWDIGNSDGTAVWVVQHIEHEFRLVNFYEAWGEPYSHAIQWLQSLGVTWDTHYLPHDAEHVRQGKNVNKSPREMLEELMPGARFEVVPRIEDVNWGIQQTRDVFPILVFDETNTKNGIIHLEQYRKKWNERQACWSDKPDKAGGHSEAADALRQLGQAYAAGQLNIRKPTKKRKSRNWRVA